jgi:hypothetical protein
MPSTTTELEQKYNNLNISLRKLEHGNNAANGELLNKTLLYNKNLVHNITLGVIIFVGLTFYMKFIK